MQTFHLIIGEFHVDDTPIRVAARFYQSFMEKNPDAKITICLEMTQESPAAIMKYISDKKSLSDALYAAAEAKFDLEALSQVTKNEMQTRSLQTNPRDIQKSIMMNLLCRNRVLAYEQCCSAWMAGDTRLKGIDFEVVPGMLPPNELVSVRSMYMLEQLKEFQDEGYSTIFVVGQQHLIDLKQFMQSPAAPQLSNCHFLSVVSAGTLPFVPLDSFSNSVQKRLSALKTAIESEVLPQTCESIFNAEISILRGNPDEVVLEATKSLAVFYKERGTAFFKAKDYASALIAYQMAEQFDPAYKEAILNQGACFNQFGQLELALERFEKALLLDPNYERAAYYQASALYRLNRFKSATAIINTNSDLPDRKETWVKLREQILDKEKEAKRLTENHIRHRRAFEARDVIVGWSGEFTLPGWDGLKQACRDQLLSKEEEACRSVEEILTWGGGVFEARDEIARWFGWSTLAAWDGLKQACKTQPRMIKALQDGVVRFDSDTPPYINGICTDDLQTCIAVIYYNPIKKQGSLIHLSRVENFARTASIEQAWVGGEGIPPVIVYNGDHPRTSEREVFFEGVRKRGWSTYDSRTGCVSLSRDGVIKVGGEASTFCQNAVMPPNSDIRVRVCHLSGCIKADAEMPIDYQYIDNQWKDFDKTQVPDIFKYAKILQDLHRGVDVGVIRAEVQNWFIGFCAQQKSEKFNKLISRYKNNRAEFLRILPKEQKTLIDLFFILAVETDFTQDHILTNQVVQQLSSITGYQFSVDHHTDGTENAAVYLSNQESAFRLKAELESIDLLVKIEIRETYNKVRLYRIRILNSHDPVVIEKVNTLFERHKAFCMSPLLTTTPMAAAHSAAGAAAPAVKIDESPILR